jgi:LCP family protein required for cell wall assembly
VPDASRLRPAIARAADRRIRLRRVRRTGLTSAGAAILVVVALLAPGATRNWFPRTTLALPGPLLMSPGPFDGQALNVLIAGTDDASLAPGSTVANGSGATDGADTIIVAHVPADRSALYLVTIERDTFVENGAGKPPIKLSDAYRQGGFARLADAVTGLTGLHFDAGVKVDLAALGALTDAVGGVHLCVELAVTSIHTGHTFPVGCYNFTGAQAIDYLRQRKDFVGVPPDLGAAGYGGIIRDRHQVQYLRALMAQVDIGSLTNPTRLTGLLQAAGKGLAVDLGAHKAADWLAAVGPALSNVVGVTTPEGNVSQAGAAGMSISDDGRAMFAAVRSEQLGPWLTGHPAAVMANTTGPVTPR